MAKYGFLSVLEEELERHLDYDFAMDWDKRNHAVEVAFVLEAQNNSGVEMVDETGQLSDQDIVFEDALLFYNPAKSKFDEEAYLAAIPYEPKKGLSREFLAYFAQFLNQTAEEGLSDLMDFLADPQAQDFMIKWDQVAFEEGQKELEETEFYGYPRY